jgi:hypothetical protein
MNKVLLGLLLCAVNSATAWFTPEVRAMPVGIISARRSKVLSPGSLRVFSRAR